MYAVPRDRIIFELKKPAAIIENRLLDLDVLPETPES